MADSETTNVFKYLISNLDKPFRILAPGAFSLFLIFWNVDIKTTLAEIQLFSPLFLLLCSIVTGMIVYAVHRTYFLIFDFLLIKQKKTKLKETWLIVFNTNHTEQNANIFYILNASIHLAAMIFEITILFSLIRKINFSIVQNIIRHSATLSA